MEIVSNERLWGLLCHSWGISSLHFPLPPPSFHKEGPLWDTVLQGWAQEFCIHFAEFKHTKVCRLPSWNPSTCLVLSIYTHIASWVRNEIMTLHYPVSPETQGWGLWGSLPPPQHLAQCPAYHMLWGQLTASSSTWLLFWHAKVLSFNSYAPLQKTFKVFPQLLEAPNKIREWCQLVAP